MNLIVNSLTTLVLAVLVFAIHGALPFSRTVDDLVGKFRTVMPTVLVLALT